MADKKESELQDLGTDGLALIVTIMQRNNNDADYVLNQLVGSYRHSLACTHAELILMRAGLEAALSGRYQPSSDTLRDALCPSRADIEELAAKLEKGL